MRKTVLDSITIWSAELTIRQGIDYDVDLVYVDADKNEEVQDLSDFHVIATIRPFPEDYEPIRFDASIDPKGIHLHLDQSVTNNIRFERGSYDVWLEWPDRKQRIHLVDGRVHIVQRTSKWSKRSTTI